MIKGCEHSKDTNTFNIRRSLVESNHGKRNVRTNQFSSGLHRLRLRVEGDLDSEWIM